MRGGRFGQVTVTGVAVMLGALVTLMASTPTAPAATSDCGPPAPAAMLVTADCVDPRFNDPYIDIDEMRDTPVPHRYVHGGFTGTGARFSFYQVVDAQVKVPPRAAPRKGIQPVVELKVNGGERAEVAVGKPVTLSAMIEVPPNTGKVVAVEWNFEGAGIYVSAKFGDIKPAVSVQATHSYSQPGTYFPVLRATSQREGDPETPFGRVQSLGRARVVVR